MTHGHVEKYEWAKKVSDDPEFDGLEEVGDRWEGWKQNQTPFLKRKRPYFKPAPSKSDLGQYKGRKMQDCR